jgi:hypothetical protein
VRSGFRDVASLRRDRFLTADMLASMPLQAGRCRAKRFDVLGGITLFRSHFRPFFHRSPARTSTIKIVR